MKRLSFLTTRFCMLLTLLSSTLIFVQAEPSKPAEGPSIEGRWDLTLIMDGKEYPSWLEVQHSGVKTLFGRFVYLNGSARPISKIDFDSKKFSFTIPPQWESESRDLVFEGEVTPAGIAGTMVFVDGKKYDWKGTLAPSLKRDSEPVWGEPVNLFNGVNLKGWHAMGENQWKVEDGILRSLKSGSNLVTDQKFTDFQLHIEFRYQKASNSGVYLRGRYEVQIIDCKGIDPSSIYLGGVYGFLTPSENVAKDPGVWQSYDITLRGRMVTIIANNKLIIFNQAIPGITGGAIDSKESEPGPLYLQGDHGPIDFRNIIITPIK
jgi:hypothetical protein